MTIDTTQPDLAIQSDLTFQADFHFGLIPADRARNNQPLVPRKTPLGHMLKAALPGSSNNLQDVVVITDGDSWTEWGEHPSDYSDDDSARDGSGHHVIVRFGAQPTLEPTYYPKEKWGPHNPTGVHKSVEYLAAERAREFFRLAIPAVEVAFADLLADGWRLCDYAVLTSALDWSQPAIWDAGEASVRVMGMYA